MARDSKVTEEDLLDIMHRISLGEKIAPIAREYGITDTALSQRIYKFKKRGGTLVASVPSSTPGMLPSSEEPKQITIEDAIDGLVDDFIGKLRALIIRQITQNLRGM